jgi:uncharacterized protein with GYD domain
MTETFVLLTRVANEEVNPANAFLEKEKAVKEKVQECCPGVTWAGSYAMMGAWNYLDIFEAQDATEAMKVAAVVRYYGDAHVELWPAVAWPAYKGVLRELDAADM